MCVSMSIKPKIVAKKDAIVKKRDFEIVRGRASGFYSFHLPRPIRGVYKSSHGPGFHADRRYCPPPFRDDDRRFFTRRVRLWGKVRIDKGQGMISASHMEIIGRLPKGVRP